MNVRPSPIAGSWYPAERKVLQEMVEGFLSRAAPERIDGTLIGLVVPHAGYGYSGQVAAQAFAHLYDFKPRWIAVLSPFHEHHPAPLLTSPHAAYRTPLGQVPVDQDLLSKLDVRLQLRTGEGLVPLRFDREHALEIELPFLQVILQDFKILPLMVRTRNHRLLRALGEELAKLLPAGDSLLVASSDLSHFLPVNSAQRMDREMLHRIVALDPEAVMYAEIEGCGYACGAPAIAAALWAARKLGADQARQTGYATSAEFGGSAESVVGYGSVVYWKSGGKDLSSHDERRDRAGSGSR